MDEISLIKLKKNTIQKKLIFSKKAQELTSENFEDFPNKFLTSSILVYLGKKKKLTRK